jgi:hypothetical protein
VSVEVSVWSIGLVADKVVVSVEVEVWSTRADDAEVAELVSSGSAEGAEARGGVAVSVREGFPV